MAISREDPWDWILNCLRAFQQHLHPAKAKRHLQQLQDDTITKKPGHNLLEETQVICSMA
jgi:hypothetical protein